MPNQDFSGFDLPNTFAPSGKNYLYIVGIDEYRDTKMPRLYNAKLDAERIRDVLQQKYQFTSELTTCHFDGEGTQGNITGFLRSLVGKVTEEDNFLMYFAGHGEYDSALDVGYWIPYDATRDQIGSYISFDLVTRLIRAIKTRHTFIVTDSCYSGSIFTQKRDTSYVDRLESMPSRWLLTAGRNEPVGDGRPGQHSPFAQAVLATLKNNYQNRMRVSEFCDRVLRGVGQNVQDQLPRGASLYDVGDMGGEFMFRLKEFATTPVPEPRQAAAQPAGPNKGGLNRGGGEGPAPRPEPEPHREPASVSDLKEQLENYLRKNRFEKVFKLLNKYMAKDSYNRDTIIFQEGRYNGLLDDNNMGTITQEQFNLTRNRIRAALQSLVDDLEHEDFDSAKLSGGKEPPPPPPQNGLTPAEQEGLEKQRDLLQRKLNMLKTEKIKAYDAMQKFTLEEQINETEHQLEEVKKKLNG